MFELVDRHGRRVASTAPAQAGRLIATVDVPNDGVFLAYRGADGVVHRVRPITRALEVGDTVTFRLRSTRMYAGDLIDLIDLGPEVAAECLEMDDDTL